MKFGFFDLRYILELISYTVTSPADEQAVKFNSMQINFVQGRGGGRVVSAVAFFKFARAGGEPEIFWFLLISSTLSSAYDHSATAPPFL